MGGYRTITHDLNNYKITAAQTVQFENGSNG